MNTSEYIRISMHTYTYADIITYLAAASGREGRVAEARVRLPREGGGGAQHFWVWG